MGVGGEVDVLLQFEGAKQAAGGADQPAAILAPGNASTPAIGWASCTEESDCTLGSGHVAVLLWLMRHGVFKICFCWPNRA